MNAPLSTADLEALWTKCGERPYTRRDGSQTSIVLWSRPCIVCRAPFTVTVPQGKGPGQSNSFLALRCERHKRDAA